MRCASSSSRSARGCRPHRPRVDGRIDIAECEFVRGKLAARVHVPLAEEEHELVFGELGVEARERDHLEREIPRGVPRVLPLVGHRDDVFVIQVTPVAVAAALPGLGRARGLRITVQPIGNVEVVELLAPEQAGGGLSGDEPFLRRKQIVTAAGTVVEGIGLVDALIEGLFEFGGVEP